VMMNRIVVSPSQAGLKTGLYSHDE